MFAFYTVQDESMENSRKDGDSFNVVHKQHAQSKQPNSK
jgi:hypothetical protein